MRQTTYDIERLQRRIMIKTIQPYELYNLDLAYHTIQEIFTILGESDIPIILEKLLPSRETLEQFIIFTTNFQKTFCSENTGGSPRIFDWFLNIFEFFEHSGF